MGTSPLVRAAPRQPGTAGAICKQHAMGKVKRCKNWGISPPISFIIMGTVEPLRFRTYVLPGLRIVPNGSLALPTHGLVFTQWLMGVLWLASLIEPTSHNSANAWRHLAGICNA